jgi:isoleucyl-tRNA synthetase
MKRRWPLSKMIVVASQEICTALKNIEELFLELSNVKTVEYAQQAPEYASKEGWVCASEENIQVFLDAHRDEALLGEGLMRDLARRVQSLRKELGYMPGDILEAIHIAELNDESIKLLKLYLKEMEELVRAKKIYLDGTREEVKAEWHENQLDDRKIYIAILQ